MHTDFDEYQISTALEWKQVIQLTAVAVALLQLLLLLPLLLCSPTVAAIHGSLYYSNMRDPCAIPPSLLLLLPL